MDGWKDEWLEAWMPSEANGWTEGCVVIWLDEEMSEWLRVGVDEQRNGWRGG